MSKSAYAFRTISEVADWLDTPTHVLRFWESKFLQIKPVKRAGGRRYYRPEDMLLIGGIKQLLHKDGLTIKGAQKILHEKGAKHVSSFSKPLGVEDLETNSANVKEKPNVQNQPVDWQPIQISDFATDVSKNIAATLLPVGEKENVDLGSENDGTTAYASSTLSSTQNSFESLSDPSSAEEPNFTPQSNEVSEEQAKGLIGSRPESKHLSEALLTTKDQVKTAKNITSRKKDFENFQSSFEDEQPVLNFWDDDRQANPPEAKLQNEALSNTVPLVKPTYDSVMAHLKTNNLIGQDKTALLKPILLMLEKRLEQRAAG